jgi:ABC-2 type transport system permease protein
MRLLLVELSRFRARRAIALIVLGAVLLTAYLAVATVWDTRPVGASERASAQAQATADSQSPAFKRELARCEKHPQRYLGEGNASMCVEQMTPRPEWYLNRTPLSLENVQQDAGVAVVLLVAALMVIAGTTFAGADWASGSISNQLLFEPRRVKVWLAKAGAVFLATLVASAAITAAFWVTLYLVAEARGIPTGAGVQEAIRAMAGRGVLLAAVGALGGFAATMLLRHTVGTLAVMFAYAVGGAALTEALPITGVGRWNLSNNVFAWIYDGYKYYDHTLPCPMNGDCNQSAFLSLGHGVAYLAVLLAIVVVASVALFRRRDIA